MAGVVVAVLFLFEKPLHAYFDPGSGSMLVQVLLGGCAALGVLSKLYWTRLTAVFGRRYTSRSDLESTGRLTQ